MTNWTIDGETLEAMGVQTLRFSEANQDHSTAEITLVDRGEARRTWARWQKVEIRKDGEVFFVGWVDSADSAESSGDSGKQIVIKGPWMWLEETTFSRRFELATGGIFATSVKLFKKGGQRLTVIEQIFEVLNCAVSASGGQFSIGQISPGQVPDLPPEEWVSAQSCADVFRRVAGWAPSACVWIEQGITPTLHWTQPGQRRTHSFTKGSRPLVSASVRPESSMAPTAVVIQYNTAQNEYEGVSFPVRQDVFPANSEAGTPGAAVFVLGAEEDRRQSWAQQLFSLARQWLWSGDLELVLPAEKVLPGDLVRLAGRSEWQGCEAVVQTVNVDTQADRWTVTLGPPSHLGLSDLRDLLWWMKRGQSQAVDEPVLNLHPFQIYTDFNWLSVPFKKDVKIAVGSLNFGQSNVTPTWKGIRLDSEPQPKENLARDYKKTFWIRVVWQPDTAEFGGNDALGAFVTGFKAVSTGTVIEAQIVENEQPMTAPFVNEGNGGTRPGVFYFKVGTVEEIDGEIRVTQSLQTDLSLLFIPPVYLYQVKP